MDLVNQILQIENNILLIHLKWKKNDNTTTPNLQTKSDNKQDANGQKYNNGFMYKSQADVESNVGSMDRLQRLKAIQIRKYAN